MEVGEKLMAAQLSHEPIHLFYTLHTHHPFPLLYHTLFIPCTSPHLSPSLPSFMAPTSQAEAHTNGDSKAQQESQQRETKGRHQGVGHKSLLQTDDLFQYILDTSVYPREHQALRGLRAMTAKHRWNLMTCPADEGQFLNLLVKLINAKNTMEIGVYTGYSLLSTALALPDYGKIIAMDIHRQNYELGVPFLKEAGVYHKIDFREGAALSQLDEMLKDESKHGFFDFIFMDADKDNYLNYHERLIKLVKPGGLIGYDNTLWNGAVAAPEEVVESYPKYVKYYLPFVMELNKVLAADQRIEISQLPVGDGLTLCRRLN